MLPLLASLLVGSFLGVSYGQNPGLRTLITSNGFSYISKVGLPILKQELSNIQIPDVSGSADVDIIGSIDYTLSNIKLLNPNIATFMIKSGTTGLSVEATGVSIDGTTDWQYSNHAWIHISDSGSADLSATISSLSITVDIGKDPQGHATLKVTNCVANIGDVSVEFHGGASWLYNLFDSSIASTIKNSINGKLCDGATQAINTRGSSAVESLPVVVQIDQTAEVSYALTSNPIFTSNYVETQHKGEFLSIAMPVESSLSPVKLPEISSYDRMMYVWLTEYTINTAGIVYHNAGVLQYAVTPDVVPETFPIKLNTASFESLIPPLYKTYPNLDMEMLINSTKPPLLRITPNGANFTVTGSVQVNVLQPKNRTKTNAFTIGITVHSSVRAWVHPNGTNQVVSTNCTLLKFDFNLIKSNIGRFSLEPLENSINLLIKVLFLPILNKFANAGLMIPMVDGLSFVNPNLVFGQGYILIDTDLNYSLPQVDLQRSSAAI